MNVKKMKVKQKNAKTKNANKKNVKKKIVTKRNVRIDIEQEEENDERSRRRRWWWRRTRRKNREKAKKQSLTLTLMAVKATKCLRVYHLCLGICKEKSRIKFPTGISIPDLLGQQSITIATSLLLFYTVTFDDICLTTPS